MTREATARAYLAAMAAGDLDGVLACFTPDGRVSSPVYGGVLVADFYRRLFADTRSASVAVRTVYASTDGRLAVHFDYRWELASGKATACDVVDLFDFESDRIAHLQVLFDTAKIGNVSPGD